MNKKLRVATVFSGIGSFEWALKRMGIAHEIIFACDNGEIQIEDLNYSEAINEIRNLSSIEDMRNFEKKIYENTKKKNYVELTYKANYTIDDRNYHYDIRLLDGTKFKDEVDIFVGGSPCQSFSIMGYQKGLDDTRGTLFYEYARLINEIKPKIFIFENVQGILNHDKKRTWEIIERTFDSLGYFYDKRIYNAKDFGIPQNRNRLFVVGFRDETHFKKFTFPTHGRKLSSTLQDFLIEYCKEGSFSYSLKVKDPGEVDEKYYLSEKVLKHVMSEGTKNYKVKPKTDLEIARPLLATMHKMHRAGVDNYVTVNGRVRRLTPRECLRLMGFGDDFNQVVSNTQQYKQAGNSIVVDIFMELIKGILKTKL